MFGDSSSKGTISVQFGFCGLGSVTQWEFSNGETKKMESSVAVIPTRLRLRQV